MNKTKTVNFEPQEKITVDTEGLQELLSVGRKTAVDLGTSANAKVVLGRRVLWNVGKIKKYVDTLSE